MLKNIAGQNITAVLLDTAGAVVTTGTTTVYVLGDAGTQASMGTATHEGNGQWSIDVTQAESNYDDIGFLWVNTGAVTINQHVFTDQSYDRLGAPAGASVSADLVVIDNFVDGLESTIGAAGAGLTNLGASGNNWNVGKTGYSLTVAPLTAVQVNAEVDSALADYDGPTNTEMVSAFTEIKGGTFSGATDSLEAIRDRGDAAWTTGAGGSSPQILQNTTIATLASQTSFTLTAGSADNDAYNNQMVVIEDAATATQKAIGLVSDYVGATRTVTLDVDPAVFTMAAGDTIDIIAISGSSVGLEIDANGRVDVGFIAGTAQGAINTTAGAVDTVTTNTDMRGTDGANTVVPTAAAAQTSQFSTTDGLINGLNNAPAVSVADILTTQMTEAYAADGVAPTLAQAIFLIQQTIGDFSISGTTLTAKQLDGTTGAATYTLDSASAPTSRTRST